MPADGLNAQERERFEWYEAGQIPAYNLSECRPLAIDVYHPSAGQELGQCPLK